MVQEILYIVSNYPGGYRTIYDLIYDGKSPEQTRRESLERNLRNTLSRMKRNGLLNNAHRNWSVTHEGKMLLAKRKEDIPKLSRSYHNKDRKFKKEVIVVFDIPEKRRRYRDWLRDELTNLGFQQIQKSVWFGPTLPKEFVNFLDEERLLKYVRFFKVSKKDLI